MPAEEEFPGMFSLRTLLSLWVDKYTANCFFFFFLIYLNEWFYATRFSLATVYWYTADGSLVNDSTLILHFITT